MEEGGSWQALSVPAESLDVNPIFPGGGGGVGGGAGGAGGAGGEAGSAAEGSGGEERGNPCRNL